MLLFVLELHVVVSVCVLCGFCVSLFAVGRSARFVVSFFGCDAVRFSSAVLRFGFVGGGE